MIAFLEGLLDFKQPTRILVNVNGVGYEVSIPVSTYDQLPEEGEKLRIHTTMIVREDSMQLYGFASLDEKEFFHDLIAISGIGPKVATGILSGTNLQDFRDFIITNNLARLKNLPGIGKKTAERLVLELKDKYARSAKTMGIGTDAATTPSYFDDAVLALVSLGYSKAAVVKILDQIIKESSPVSMERLIKEALRRL
ncbi:MAG: Holliday junction branch migration protein RuvA [Deferribacteres bacterium]|nr:Holliday junction branch migration protein RuvA [candidate division KSB1 bacterium]MCB9502615.1 Holliday junction branch migration protein RuvA [Deferribacteres bacterium]